MGITDKVWMLASGGDVAEFKSAFLPILDSETYLRVFDTEDCRVMTVSEVCQVCESWRDGLAKPHVMCLDEITWLRIELTELIERRSYALVKEVVHYENLALANRQREIDHGRRTS